MPRNQILAAMRRADTMAYLRDIAADPQRHAAMTARAEMEESLGRKLGCLRALKRDDPATYAELRAMTARNVRGADR
jgi:hypothetical protein